MPSPVRSPARDLGPTGAVPPLGAEPAGCTDGVALPWLCVPVWGVAAAGGGACALLTAAAAALAVRRRRRAQRRREEALLPNEAD